MDLRIQQEIRRLGGKTRVQLIGELFNLLNHDNFGAFVTQIDNARFGEPSAILGNAYVPRDRGSSVSACRSNTGGILDPCGYREVGLAIGDDADAVRRALRPLWAAARAHCKQDRPAAIRRQ